ncbi:unnamed protein product, partial [Ectocarpus sp. 12 AP-2014]
MNPSPPPPPPSSDLPPSSGTVEQWAPAVDDDPTLETATNNGQPYPHAAEGATQAQAPRQRQGFAWCCSRNGQESGTTTLDELEGGIAQEAMSTAPNGQQDGVTMGDLLPDSIYRWACGEKA